MKIIVNSLEILKLNVEQRNGIETEVRKKNLTIFFFFLSYNTIHFYMNLQRAEKLFRLCNRKCIFLTF